MVSPTSSQLGKKKPECGQVQLERQEKKSRLCRGQEPKAPLRTTFPLPLLLDRDRVATNRASRTTSTSEIADHTVLMKLMKALEPEQHIPDDKNILTNGTHALTLALLFSGDPRSVHLAKHPCRKRLSLFPTEASPAPPRWPGRRVRGAEDVLREPAHDALDGALAALGLGPGVVRYCEACYTRHGDAEGS